MHDSRLRQVTACLDDARCAVADMLDELRDSEPDALVLRRVRKLCNDAISHIQSLETP